MLSIKDERRGFLLFGSGVVMTLFFINMAMAPVDVLVTYFTPFDEKFPVCGANKFFCDTSAIFVFFVSFLSFVGFLFVACQLRTGGEPLVIFVLCIFLASLMISAIGVGLTPAYHTGIYMNIPRALLMTTTVLSFVGLAGSVLAFFTVI